MKTCEIIDLALSSTLLCEETPLGSLVLTHCLYPSFDRVAVYVRKHLDGFVVTDSGESIGKTWLHGRDTYSIRRAAKRAADHFGCVFENDQFSLNVPSQDWLSQAIVAVANAAAESANAAVESVSVSSERSLVTKVRNAVDISPLGFESKIQHPVVGRSGKTHKFDLLVTRQNANILIDIVVPHPGSIAAKYLALSDTEVGKDTWKFALFDRELAQEDKALLSNVADLLPVDSIVTTAGRVLLVH